MTTQAHLYNDSQPRLQEVTSDVNSENVRKRVTIEIIQKCRVQVCRVTLHHRQLTHLRLSVLGPFVSGRFQFNMRNRSK